MWSAFPLPSADALWIPITAATQDGGAADLLSSVLQKARRAVLQPSKGLLWWVLRFQRAEFLACGKSKTGAAGKVRLFVLIKRLPRWQATAITSAPSDVLFTETPDVNVSKSCAARSQTHHTHRNTLTCLALNIINVGDFYNHFKIRSVLKQRVRMKHFEN